MQYWRRKGFNLNAELKRLWFSTSGFYNHIFRVHAEDFKKLTDALWKKNPAFWLVICLKDEQFNVDSGDLIESMKHNLGPGLNVTSNLFTHHGSGQMDSKWFLM